MVGAASSHVLGSLLIRSVCCEEVGQGCCYYREVRYIFAQPTAGTMEATQFFPCSWLLGVQNGLYMLRLGLVSFRSDNVSQIFQLRLSEVEFFQIACQSV